MKKLKLLVILCVLLFPLVFVLPIPHKLKDGGTIHLKPIWHIYDVYIYNTEMVEGDRVSYKKGYGVHLFGLVIYEKLYYTSFDD